jgi:VanZ family protein
MRALRSYAPAILFATLVLWIGSRTSLPVPIEATLPLDKLGHFLMYAGLGALAAWGWQRALVPHRALWPIVVCLLIGLGDELHQLRVPSRSAEFGDWLADAAGVLVGFMITVKALGGRRAERRAERTDRAA